MLAVHKLDRFSRRLTVTLTAMVNCVMIDPSFDGNTFNIAISDVPDKKNDPVKASYELPAPESPTTVAVKIVDMLRKRWWPRGKCK